MQYGPNKIIVVEEPNNTFITFSQNCAVNEALIRKKKNYRIFR